MKWYFNGINKMLAKKNEHPRDLFIKFYENYNGRNHVYLIDGIEGHPTSVTTLIHNHFPKFDGPAIIEKYYYKWQRDPSSKYYGKSKQQIENQWEEDRVKASSLGTIMHRDIELFFNEELEKEPETVEFQYFKNFWNDLKRDKPDFNIYRTEWLVWNKTGKIAGSIDCVLKTGLGEFIILDWKRSKQLEFTNGFGRIGSGPLSCFQDCNYAHYSIQLNCYKYILETCYGPGVHVRGMYLVVLHPNNQNYILQMIPDLQPIVSKLINDE
jgi:hypothetical protein